MSSLNINLPKDNIHIYIQLVNGTIFLSQLEFVRGFKNTHDFSCSVKQSHAPGENFLSYLQLSFFNICCFPFSQEIKLFLLVFSRVRVFTCNISSLEAGSLARFQSNDQIVNVLHD